MIWSSFAGVDGDAGQLAGLRAHHHISQTLTRDRGPVRNAIRHAEDGPDHVEASLVRRQVPGSTSSPPNRPRGGHRRPPLPGSSAEGHWSRGARPMYRGQLRSPPFSQVVRAGPGPNPPRPPSLLRSPACAFAPRPSTRGGVGHGLDCRCADTRVRRQEGRRNHLTTRGVNRPGFLSGSRPTSLQLLDASNSRAIERPEVLRSARGPEPPRALPFEDVG
jgi:hypothetical protein